MVLVAKSPVNVKNVDTNNITDHGHDGVRGGKNDKASESVGEVFLSGFNFGFVTTSGDPVDATNDGVEEESETANDDEGFPELRDIKSQTGSTSSVGTKVLEGGVGDGSVGGFDKHIGYKPSRLAGFNISTSRTVPTIPAMA